MKRLGPIGYRTLAALLALLALDVGLRQFGNWGRWVVQERHGFYGWQMLPNQNRWSRYFEVRERTNSLGYRDREWSAVPAAVRRTYQPGFPALSPVAGNARDDDVVRIAVVGNSMTYGSSVPEEEVWTRLLENLLNNAFAERGDRRRVEVMNFAVQGYVFEQMARVFDTRIAPFLPDLLIVPTTTFDVGLMGDALDDFDYPLRRLVVRTAIHDYLHRRVIRQWMPPAEAPRDREAPPSRREVLSAEARWEGLEPDRRADARVSFARFIAMAPEDLTEAQAVRWWAARTPAEQWTLWSQAQGREKIALYELLAPQEREEARRHIARDLVAIPYRPEMRYVWEHAAERMTDVRHRLEAHGGRLALVALPSLQRIGRAELPSPSSFWGPWAREQRDTEGRRTVIDYDPVEPMRAEMPHLAAFLRDPASLVTGERGIQTIPEHAPGYETTLFFPNDIGHYNARGHAVLAREVAQVLLRTGVLDP